MSTGMQNIQSIEASVTILREADIPFALLECTNLYPSPPEIVSLQGISELKKAFPDALVGFSDHSIGVKHQTKWQLPLLRLGQLLLRGIYAESLGIVLAQMFHAQWTQQN